MQARGCGKGALTPSKARPTHHSCWLWGLDGPLAPTPQVPIADPLCASDVIGTQGARGHSLAALGPPERAPAPRSLMADKLSDRLRGLKEERRELAPALYWLQHKEPRGGGGERWGRQQPRGQCRATPR